MSDTLITVVAILLAAVLMFVFPLMTTADKADKVAQSNVETIVSDFVNDVKNTGELTEEKYERFVASLPSQYAFDVEVEIWKLDENVGKKTTQTNNKKIGENVYVGYFTSDVLVKIHNNGKFDLAEGDIVKVNVTSRSSVSDNFSVAPSADITSLSASASATVTTTGK